MVDFRSGYQPPGVYVSTDSSGSVAAVGVNDTVICLIGNGLGYNIASESVSFAAGNTAALTHQGIDTTSVVVTGVINQGGVPTQATFAPDAGGTPHDYSVAQAGSGTATTSTISRTVSGTIPASGTVLVTYHYTDDAYFELNKFSSYAAFVDAYGVALDPVDGSVQSPLSLAAMLAFQAGANVIYAVALDGSGSVVSQFQDAYTLTLPNFDINVVVPLCQTAVDGSSAQALATALSAHLNAAENEGVPRMGFFGLAQSFTGETPDILAGQLGYRRIVAFWPQAFLFYNSQINATQTLDGFYFAAACAGVIANQSINRGLTQSQIPGFAGIPASVARSLTQSNKNVWSSKGVSVAEMDRAGRLVVRHGVTSQVDFIQNREISIVREQDALLNLIKVGLTQADLIGDPIISTTALSVKNIISGALETALASNIIQGYKNFLVRQQQLPTGDPTLVEATLDYQPTYPLNYITVVLTLDLNTGNLNTTVDSASSSSNSNG